LKVLVWIASLAVVAGLYLLLAALVNGHPVPYLLAALISVLLVGALGVLIYRFTIQTVPDGSEGLLYLIITTGVFIFLEGFNLIAFGSEGSNLPPVSSALLKIGNFELPSQKLFVVLSVGVMLVLLFALFERTLVGKALRATAINRLGSRLVGISPTQAGMLAWGLSAALSALGGILIAPIIIVNFDTGLPLGLKGFIGAVISGFASYPGAVLGGVLVGLLESLASYINSGFREIIVYSLLFVILLARVARLSRKRQRAKRGNA
jgi:branched-chain amino acid transport system permease protein